MFHRTFILTIIHNFKKNLTIHPLSFPGIRPVPGLRGDPRQQRHDQPPGKQRVRHRPGPGGTPAAILRQMRLQDRPGHRHHYCERTLCS